MSVRLGFVPVRAVALGTFWVTTWLPCAGHAQDSVTARREIDLTLPEEDLPSQWRSARFLLDIGLGGGLLSVNDSEEGGWNLLMRMGFHIPAERLGIRPVVALKLFGGGPFSETTSSSVRAPIPPDSTCQLVSRGFPNNTYRCTEGGAPAVVVLDVAAGGSISWALIDRRDHPDLLLVLGGLYSFTGLVDGAGDGDAVPTGPTAFLDLVIICNDPTSGACLGAGLNLSMSWLEADGVGPIQSFAANFVVGFE